MNYTVLQIDKKYATEWILRKHYAHRKCNIVYCFGLFDNAKKLVGVCTFGYPPNYNYNSGKCIFDNYTVKTLELNRLITNDGLEKNALSFFVAKSLGLLPNPIAIVSYADPNAGHYGYIYQATNWIYTGESTPKFRYWFEDGNSFDIRRGIDRKIIEHGRVVKKEKLLPTQRYIYLSGNKKQIREMKKSFKLPVLAYPKGENSHYNANYECKEIYLGNTLI